MDAVLIIVGFVDVEKVECHELPGIYGVMWGTLKG
jgi:hypothetical protein